jgi:hypothetical protein
MAYASACNGEVLLGERAPTPLFPQAKAVDRFKAREELVLRKTEDYTLARGTLRFAAGETSKRITLLVTNEGRETRVGAVRRVAGNPEFARREFNAAFVLMQYFGYLRRDPDAEGFNFWLGKLEQFGSNFVNAEMVKAFISSDEYNRRFGAGD